MSLRDELGSRFRAQLASKAVKTATGAVLTIGLARLLDPGGYGLLFLALAIVSIFQMLARFGLARSAGRYVAEYRETDPTQVPFIVRTALFFNVAAIAVAVFVLAGSHGYIASVLNEPDLVPFLLFGVLFVALGTSVSFLEKVLQGFEAVRFVAYLSAFERTSRLVLALGLVVAGFGAIGAFFGYVLAFLLTSVVGFVYLFRRVQHFRDTTATIEAGLRRRIAEYAVPVMVTNTSMVLDNKIDTFLVGYFLSPVSVGFYVIGWQVVRFAVTPMNALSFTISPTFGAQKAAGNVGRISRMYEETLMNALVLYVPAGAGIVLVADPSIRLLFGPEYGGAVDVIRVFGLYVVLRAVTKISDNGLDYLGRARERAIARGITAVLNFALNILLIPTMGVVGAAIATVATYSLYTAANVYIAAQEFDLRVWTILRKLSVITVITVAMSAVVFALRGYISGWVTLAVVVGLGGVVWGVLSVATGLLEVREILSSVT